MRKTAAQQAAGETPQALPGVASLAINPARIERLWKLTRTERVNAARRGEFTLGEMLRWAVVLR